MNPTELLNPRCKITGTKPIVRSTRHLFLDLPRLSDSLQQYIDDTSKLGGWSANCVQVCAVAVWRSGTVQLADLLLHVCMQRRHRAGTTTCLLLSSCSAPIILRHCVHIHMQTNKHNIIINTNNIMT